MEKPGTKKNLVEMEKPIQIQRISFKRCYYSRERVSVYEVLVG